GKAFDHQGDGDVLLFADTFNRHFDPETLYAAKRVMERNGHSVGVAAAPGRPLCCGRSFLSAGLKEKAVSELTRTTDIFTRALKSGKIIVGLEPSCTLMFRDEAVNLIPEWTAEMGAQILTFAEHLQRHPPKGIALQDTQILVHGHCHQKAMGVADATVQALNGIPGVRASMIDSSCCGMAGPFGYQAETESISRDMAELSLAPTVRAAPQDTLIVADGFSCRCQIKDVTERDAKSLAKMLDQAASR
ncbi:MAG: (Fe-S)-binding protein, partial [Paracoccaceae bacterium]